MTKASAALGSAIFFFAAPGVVAGVIPWLISQWRVSEPLFGLHVLRYFGAVMVAIGLLGLVDSFIRFAVTGLGTPAPILPTRSLVVSGLYRYVRNPMYVAVLSIIVGQGIVLGNLAVLAYGALVCAMFTLFVRLYEEPRLAATFGAQYDQFKAHVPRWIPRLRPWRGDHDV